jgi:hypothetical protein
VNRPDHAIHSCDIRPALDTDSQQHHRDVPVDACDSETIVALGPDNPQRRHGMRVRGNPGFVHSVEHVARGIRSIEDKVPAHHVVHVPVVVVVLAVRLLGEAVAVGSGFAGVAPDVVSNVRMVVTKPVVHNRYDDVIASSRDGPSPVNVEIDSWRGVNRLF